MRVEVEVGGKSMTVDIDSAGAELRARIDGRPVTADAVWISNRELSLVLEGRSYDFELAKPASGPVLVKLRGHTLSVGLGGSASVAKVSRGQARQVVEAPMPGKVVAVLVEVGDSVTVGQGLVVVEAMKMENELQSACEGTITAVHASAGQIVESGVKLVEVTARQAAETEAC